jgi:Flp pilus assembly protein TadD
MGKHQYPAAIAEFQKVLAISKDDAGALSELARAYAYHGQRLKSETILSRSAE